MRRNPSEPGAGPVCGPGWGHGPASQSPGDTCTCAHACTNYNSCLSIRVPAHTLIHTHRPHRSGRVPACGCGLPVSAAKGSQCRVQAAARPPTPSCPRCPRGSPWLGNWTPPLPEPGLRRAPRFRQPLMHPQRSGCPEPRLDEAPTGSPPAPGPPPGASVATAGPRSLVVGGWGDSGGWPCAERQAPEPADHSGALAAPPRPPRGALHT